MSNIYDTAPKYLVNLEHVRWGRFSTHTESDGPDADASEVVFAQTAVNLLDPEHTALVEQLAPVRENVTPELLSFDALIQRDLDDARVSNALIPYLLDRAPGHVKMFPSILVLLLPMKDEQVEARYLPRHARPPEVEGPFERVPVAYGDGDRRWAFEFSRLRTSAGSFLPYGAHLRINPQFTSLAIVDGQHRAMAVLALWRNKHKWPERAKAFKDFYANHPKEELDSLDLSGLSLPVTVCYFPNLHEGAADKQAALTVVRAARRLFLDVNRTAKTPSRARQVLLDDRRVTSDFVRAVMSRIKDNPRGDDGLRLCNLYYDQIDDNESRIPRLAVTSVLHIQYAIRCLLMGRKQHGSERLVTRTDFQSFDPGVQDNNRVLVDLLGWEDLFGPEATAWKDETIPYEHRDRAIQSFMATWGATLDRFLEDFPAFRALAVASNWTRHNLDSSNNDEDPIVKRMLFEGQGVRAVHDGIREQLENAEGGASYPESTKLAFKRQGERLHLREHQTTERAAEWFWGGGAGSKWPQWLTEDDKTKLVTAFAELGTTLFKTKAFQVGFMMSVGHIERKLSEKERAAFWKYGGADVLLERVFRYFAPSDGFPGNALGQEKKLVWATASVETSRFAGLHGQGLYRHVRDVLGGDLKDGRWQIGKYWFMEVYACTGLKDVVAVDTQWLDRRQALGDPKDVLEALLARIREISVEAVWQYRDELLTKDFDRENTQWRSDNPTTPADAAMESQFWDKVRERLCTKLVDTLKIKGIEAQEVRKRGRGAPPPPPPPATVEPEESIEG